ncbi:hypothetical protein [Burkholderia ambifaria]|uniref:hypothetical protein n=1 Tax=Burkholderia ambifaria TaxID=152480 RepID=UPI002012C685|nr:hypothetical protein [Burkholderia ambifaria]
MAARAHDAAQALPAVDDYLLIGSVRDRAGEPDAAQQRPNCRRHRRYPNIRPRPAPPVVAHASRMDREFYFFCCHVLFTLLEPLHLPEQTEQRQADPSLCSGNANNCPKRSSTEWRPEFESKYARKQYRLVRIATAQWVFTAKYTAPLSKKIPLENHPFSASMDDTGTGARMSPSRHKPRPAWRCGSRRIFFWTFRRESRNGRPQKYARYKHVLWRRSRASRRLGAVHRANSVRRRQKVTKNQKKKRRRPPARA